MVKRVISAVLWFLTIAWAWNYIALVSGLPSLLGLALGATVGAFVWADPLDLLWHATRGESDHKAVRDESARKAALTAVSEAVHSRA